MRIRRTVLVPAAALVTVLTAGGGANAFVEHKAQERVAEEARSRLGSNADVHAELTDPLAGLKTLTGQVGTVRINADGVRHEGTSFAVDAALHGVSTDGSATSGSATVTVGYDELAERLPKPLRGMKPGTDGSHLTLSGTVGGLGVPVSVLNKVSADPDGLTVTPDSVRVMGQRMKLDTLTSLPGMERFADDLGPRTVGLGRLPEGVRLTDAKPADDGLALTFRFSPDVLRAADAPGGSSGNASGDSSGSRDTGA
ncbi:LmeA family phospholipid-binding protein [Streptomyces smyrnaeus]|uniref:LmeA family phospholipid-binding protein n=1 Tax=Streptomyces smyrnaeus TaxID=1387713 RepID=UPI0033A21ABC